MSLLTDLNEAISVPVAEGNTIPSAIPAKAHSQRLYNILNQVLPNQVYANSTKEKRVYPDCVYKLGGSTVIENMHTVTGGESIFLVTFRDKTYDGVTTVADSVSDLIEDETGIEIIDSASDYSNDNDSHEIAFEIVINTPAGGFDGNGSVIIIDGTNESQPNQTGMCVIQSNRKLMHFVIQTKDQDTLDTTKSELQTAILGYTESPDHTLIEHVSGGPLASSGGLKAWVDTYQNTTNIHD